MNRKVVTFSTVAIVNLGFFIFLSPEGFTSGSAWWTHLAFQFHHANLLHLAGNMLVLWWCLTDRWYSYIEQMVAIVLIAFGSSYLSATELPTIGFSGDVFALIGMMTPMIMSRRNALTIGLSLVLGFILPHCNGWIHLWCWLFGVIYTLIRKGYIYDLIVTIYEKIDKKNQSLL